MKNMKIVIILNTDGVDENSEMEIHTVVKVDPSESSCVSQLDKRVAQNIAITLGEFIKPIIGVSNVITSFCGEVERLKPQTAKTRSNDSEEQPPQPSADGASK